MRERRGGARQNTQNGQEVDTTTLWTVAVWAFLLAAFAARVVASRASIF